jgi:uncharacterized protein YjbJ (UPF0337 family)
MRTKELMLRRTTEFPGAGIIAGFGRSEPNLPGTNTFPELFPPHAGYSGEQKMDEHRVDGAARNLGGKIQDAVGAVTGDVATQARGQMNRAAGAAQNAYGQTVDEMRDFTTEQPITALLSALGIGVIIGLLLGRG